MTRDKVGVEMRQEDVPDAQPVFGGKCGVLVDVPLRIDDNRRAGLIVSNHIGSVRKAWQIELPEDHAASSLLASGTGGESIRGYNAGVLC